ncbi:MAG TPA: archease [Chloroflexota bacterium]|nr:archease [Chloroflexota bacterium]
MAAAAGFEVFDHTADVGVRAWGPDLAAAFAQAARGLFSLLVPRAAVRETTARAVTVAASDPESLLVAWLDELLFVFETEGLVFARFEVALPTPTTLTATAHGEPFDPARHHGGVVVKAATYHQIAVAAGPPARVQVILDI